MAIPTLTELMDKIFVDARISFIPTRYPYTYGYDFLRGHFSEVVPQDVQDALVGDYSEAEMYDLLGSRGRMADFCQKWADREGLEDYTELVTVFADAYLLENSIEKPADV